VIAVNKDVILSHCSICGRKEIVTANEFIIEMDADLKTNE